ncbi:MAG: zincin-like metallopeptidase domain-containing protein [Bryobacteraceae bacterium]
MKRETYQEITDKIIAALEAGARGDQWQRPWHVAAGTGIPMNAVSKHVYRGINVPVLWCEQSARGYASAQWATYRQWQEAGAQVKAGERAAHVVFWKFLDRAGATDPSETGERKRFPLARTFAVFNAAQVEGFTVPETTRPSEVERNARADAVVGATGAAIREHGSRAFYVPSADFVAMPPADQFCATKHGTATEAYYSTLLHELGHWTGHASRLKREFGKRFGDQAYAAEELVAELAASFLCASLGIEAEPRADHACYVASWLTVLRNDKRAIFTAARHAQAAADFILGKSDAGEEVEAVAIAA